MKTNEVLRTGEKCVSAWLNPDLADALDELARVRTRSRSAELRLAVFSHVARAGQADLIRWPLATVSSTKP